jgi:hypothetical protein
LFINVKCIKIFYQSNSNLKILQFFMKVEECTKKMNGFQFGSSIYVKLCEIIANEESIVTGKRIGKELSLSISDGIIYLQGFFFN